MADLTPPHRPQGDEGFVDAAKKVKLDAEALAAEARDVAASNAKLKAATAEVKTGGPAKKAAERDLEKLYAERNRLTQEYIDARQNVEARGPNVVKGKGTPELTRAEKALKAHQAAHPDLFGKPARAPSRPSRVQIGSSPAGPSLLDPTKGARDLLEELRSNPRVHLRLHPDFEAALAATDARGKEFQKTLDEMQRGALHAQEQRELERVRSEVDRVGRNPTDARLTGKQMQAAGGLVHDRARDARWKADFGKGSPEQRAQFEAEYKRLSSLAEQYRRAGVARSREEQGFRRGLGAWNGDPHGFIGPREAPPGYVAPAAAPEVRQARQQATRKIAEGAGKSVASQAQEIEARFTKAAWRDIRHYQGETLVDTASVAKENPALYAAAQKIQAAGNTPRVRLTRQEAAALARDLQSEVQTGGLLGPDSGREKDVSAATRRTIQQQVDRLSAFGASPPPRVDARAGLTPRSAGGGGRDVVAEINRLEQQAAARDAANAKARADAAAKQDAANRRANELRRTPVVDAGAGGDLVAPIAGSTADFNAGAEALRKRAEQVAKIKQELAADQVDAASVERKVLEEQAAVGRAAEKVPRTPAKPKGPAAPPAAKPDAAAVQGEKTAADAVRGKAGQAKRAAEYLERQNAAMRDAAPASAGEAHAAEIVARKAVAAERAVVALREQNRLMRAAGGLPAPHSNVRTLADVNAAAAARNAVPVAAGGARQPGTQTTAPGALTPQDVANRLARREQNRQVAELDAAQRRAARNEADAAQGASLLAGRNVEAARGFQASTVAVDANSNALRRHGALTTEFINAAARGSASYREWGYQIGATAAKFAGWTAVSIPVFAAIDGVRKIGQGAIASATGVQALGRTIDDVGTSGEKDRATASLRNLSQQFNLPISQVAEAVSGMGQVFHTQDEAVGGATAALYAYRTGGVAVSDATRQLTAVVAGAGLSATDLQVVFDQLNEAQNRFGATIPDTLSGLSKAAGAFTNAGGSVSELIALIATAQRVTGRSGNEIGTAISRSVGFVQRPSNQAALRSFGIDPTQSITDIYRQAFDVGRDLQGEQLQRLATALSSPQYARIFVPLIQNADRYNRILADTSPDKARGSAERERTVVLGQLDEQLKKVGVSLENLGSNLVQSHLLDGLGGVIALVNELLSLTNNLLGAFNSLPGPVRQAASYLLLGATAMRTLRRTNIGTAFEGPAGIGGGRLQNVAPFLQQSPDNYARRQIRDAMRAQSKFVEEEVRRTGTASAIAQSNYLGAQTRATSVFGNTERFVGLPEEHPQRLAAMEARAEATRAANAAREKAIQAEGDANIALDQQVSLAERDRQLSRDLKLQRRGQLAEQRSVVQLAEQYGVYTVNPTAEKGIPIRPVPIGELAGSPRSPEGFMRDRGVSTQQTPGGVVLPPGVSVPPDVVTPIAPLAGAAATTAAGRQAAARTTAEVRRRFADSLRREAQDFRTLARHESLVTAAGATAARGATVAAGAARGLGVGLGALIGPIELILAGLIAIPALYEHFKGQNDRLGQTADALGAVPQSVEQRAQQRKLAERQSKHKKDVGDALDDAWRGLLDPFHQHERARDIRRGARRTIDTLNAERDLRDRQAALGVDITGLTAGEIHDLVDADVKALKTGRITPQKYLEQLRKRLREAKSSVADPKRQSQQDDAINALITQGTPSRGLPARLLRDGLGGVGTDALSQDLDGLAAIIQLGGASRETISRYSQKAVTLAASLRGDTSPAGQQAYAKARANYEVVTNAAQTTLQTDLAVARTQRERNAAYRKYFDTVNQPLADVRALRAEAIRRRDDATGKLPAAEVAARNEARIQGAIGDRPGQAARAQAVRNAGGDSAALRHLKALREQAKTNSREAKRLDREIAAQRKLIREASAQVDEQQFQEQRALADARRQVRLGTTDAGLPRVRQALRDIGFTIARDIRRYGRNSKQVQDDILAQQQARDAVVQEQAAQIAADAQLGAAQAGSDQGSQAAIVAGDRKTLEFMRAHPKTYSKSQITQQRATLLQDMKSKTDSERQDAVDAINAHYDLLQAAIDPSDDVALAKLAAKRAAAVYAAGHFKTNADRETALAQKRTSQRAAQQAEQNEYVNHLDFLVSIGKMTTGQEVSALQRYLKTVKGNKSLRERIQQTIYSLSNQDQGGHDINPGGITLPTVNEIRRTVAGGRSGLTQTNVTTVNVTVHGPQDYDRLGKILDRTAKGSSKAIARAGRTR